jgi:hypothetical protein
MSLFISSVFTYDEDAGNYIQAVEGPSGDNQALEPATRKAINNFVIGCKQDGTWTAIKASCILAGARTLAGALVPLVGTAPTNFNFVSGDYNRKTGLVGNGSTKYLDSNRNNNADPQNNKHLAVYVAINASSTSGVLGTNSSGTGYSELFLVPSSSLTVSRINTNSQTNTPAGWTTPAFYGASRITSNITIVRAVPRQIEGTAVSQTPLNQNLDVFRAEGLHTNARLAFYSIGESLDLASLDARVTDLINAFAVTIP